jgi:anti-sigma factor RsiW
MDCAGVASHLVAYHFGATSEDDRNAIDSHLVACTSCLRTYLALKHATERAALDRPSPAVRERLRAEVARRGGRGRRGGVPLLLRRIPLYQGVALAAIAAALTIFVPRAIERGRAPEGTPKIDTARPRAESLEIY